MTAMHTPNAKIQLKSDHAENWALEKGRTTRVKAKAGSHYRVMVNADGKDSDATEVSASRHADDLHIDVLGDTKVVLENFYGECRNAACVVELAGDKPAGYTISGDSPVGAAIGDGGGLVYAYGETNPLVQTLGVSENLAGFSTKAGMSTYIPPESQAAVLTHGWVLASGIGVAATLGSAAASGTPAYTITVTAVAGKFNAADQVNIYDKDGHFLAQGQLNPGTGQYTVSITNGYRGAILVKVLDSNGNAADFNDEATGTARSLNTELRAMAMADGSTNVAVTVSPLTELAARAAGITGNVVTEANVQTNQKIGRIFGVADITGPVVTVVESGYNEANGVSAAEQYGKALAALSGADSVTGSVDATLTRLQDALVSNPADPGQLAIKQAGVDLIDSGTSAFEAGANAGSAALNIQNSQSAPWVVSASDGLNTTTEAGAGTSIKTAIGGAAAGTVVHVVWGTQSFDYTLTANDVSAGVATIAVSTSVISAAGDGDIAITTKVGSSAVSPAVIIVVDTSAPTALPDLSATTDTGVSSTDNVTQNATPIFNIGQLPAGVDSVQLLVNGLVVAATFNSANGELSPTSPLSDGVSAISYRYVRGTFTGAASPSLSVTIDSAAPAAPAITGVTDNVAPLTGAVADSGASNDNTPTVSGTAEANATVTLYQGNTVIGSTTADASGNWAYTPATARADGSYSVVAKAVDSAGNESPASSARSFTIDTVAPAAPLAAPDLTNASDTGNPTDNITSDTTPSLAIAAPVSGETVKLYVNGVAVAATYANGEITPDSALGDGVKTLTYSYVDAAGNEGPQSPALAVTIDTTAAAVPVANPSGGRLFTGTSEPGSAVTLSWSPAGGTPQTTTVTADANGNWRYPPTGLLSTGVPNGTVITVTATDVAGNPAPRSGSVAVDTLPPTLDSVQDDAGRITGSVANNAITDDATPTLSGTTGTAGGNGDVLKVFNGTTYLGDASVNSGNGTWSFTPTTPLAEGAVNLSVKWVNAGNTAVNNGGSSVFSLTVDTTAPGAPVNAPDLIASSDTGSSNSDNITSTNRPTLNLGSGLVAGDVVQLVVTVDGTETAGTYNPTTGDFIPDAPLAEGTHSIAFKTADAAGNLSAASPALTLTIDTTAPTAPASAPDLTTASDTGTSSTDDFTGDNTPAFQVGALPTGTAGVKLYVDGVEVSAQYDAATGEVTPSAALGDGTKAITYKYVDAAGNLSAASPALSITVDTTAPQMPATAPDLTNASDTGASSTDNITNDATPGFAITPPANGDSVKLYVDGVEVASTLVNGELTPVGALGDGPHAITYRYIDTAGNAGPASAGLNITIDTAVPVSPAANPSGGRLLTGVAEPGDTVTLSWTPAGGTPQTATVIANANGSWRYPDAGAPAINLPDGTAVTVTAADPAGNPAPGSATVTVSIAGPTIDSLTDDVARVLGTVARGGSTNDTQPTVTGTVGTNTGGIAGDYLRIFNGSTYLGDAVVDTVNGTWSFTPATALTEGNHALTAQWVTGGTANTDNGANASNGASSAFNFTVDTTAPAAPAAPDLLAASDTGASATDDNTTDNTPGFAVAAPASGESIKLYVDGVEVASVYDAANGTLTPTLPLGDGVHAISYGYVDAAGNVGAKSPALAVTIDTTAPTAPAAPDLIAANDTGSSATDDKTADNTPSFSVAAPAAGASIQMFVDGVQVAATYDAATGTLTPNAALADGVHAITYRTTDAAGNAGAQSAALSVTIDTTVPSAPLNAPDLTAASDTGISQTDDVTRSTTPSFAIGTLPAGVALVKLYVDGVAVAATYDAGTGVITPTAALTAGSKSITYAVVDSAGNESAPSAALAITIDTTGPSIDPTANTSSGRAFTGSAGPGDAVTLTWTEGGLAKTATVLANANGNWTYSPATQVPNATVVTVTAADPAGNPAPHTAAVTVDINAPTLDSVVDNVALQTGEVANGGLTNDATLTLSGMTGSASGNYLRVFDGSTYLGDAVVDSVTGTWSFTTPALAQASHNLQVKWVSSGTAGTNDGTLTSNGASSVRSLTVDTTSPATPASAPDLIDAHDSGANATDNITNVTQPTLNLGAGLIAGEVTAVEVTIDGVAIAGTYDTATGNFAMAQPLASGGHTVSFKLIDAAGNTSASSPTLTLTIDTTAPAAPAITGVADDVAPVTGTVVNAGPTNDTTPTIAGTAEANATVTLYNGSTLLGTTTADANGAWTYTPTTALSEGAYSITAKATDAAGNQSAASTARTFTVDTTAPATPAAAPDLTAASDTGSSSTDDTTSDTTPSFAIGQLPADASTVKLLVDGVEVAATYNASTGEVTPNSPLADGAKSITYQYVDTAGNISASSPALSITIDATTPAAPVIASVTDDAAPVTGTVANAGRTNDTTPTLAGTAEANATVALYNGSTLIGTTTADANGAWTYTPTTALAEGACSITVKATDAAGNESAASAAQTFTVDTTAPAAPAITSVTDDLAPVTGAVANAGITNDTTPTVAGTAEANATVSIYNGSSLIGTSTADGSGNWTFTPSTALAEGSFSLTAIATDIAGNESGASAARTFTVDTTAPAAPAITSVTDDVAPTTGNVANAGTTNDDKPTIAGTAEANATVKLYNGATLIGTTTADANGAWTYTPTTALASGSYSLTAKATDAAGNEGGASSPATTFTVQTSMALKLSSIESGGGGFVINGYSTWDLSGISVASADDVNGDGIDDIVIGATGADTALDKSGKAYVIYGHTGITPAIELSDIALGSGGFVINGACASDAIGQSVAAAGDINGDGLSDLLIGASDNGNHTGANRAYVVYGKTGGSAIELSAVDGGNGGFAMLGSTDHESAGYSVSSAGDVNGDGIADLMVGAFYGDPANYDYGRTYVVFGATNQSTLNLSAIAAGNGGFVINGACNNEKTGYSVSAAGDVNGDGLADMIIGELASGYGLSNGGSYVVFGKTGSAAVNLSALGAQGFKITGETGAGSAGISVSNAGDVNGDGLADLIVGAPAYFANGKQEAGRSYVIFGKAGSTTVDLAAIAGGTGGFAINGVTTNDQSGFSVAAAGDINGDGLADVLVGAYQATTNVGISSGRTYVVYGKTGTTAIQASDLVATQQGGFVLEGVTSNDYSGYSVSAAGDVNGDGFDDLLIGAYSGDPNIFSRVNAGKTYLVFGGSQFMTTVDFLGDATANTQAGTTASETFIGGAGNDSITGGGGADVMFGGTGDDTFNLDADNIAQLAAGPTGGQLARIAGGNGIDTIALAGSGLTLNLRQIANQAAGNPDGGSRIDSVERINLTGTGNNTLTLDPADVRDMAGMNLFNDGNGWAGLGSTVAKHQLLVDGNAGDVINASGYWNAAGTITVNGQTYAVYNDTSSATQLLVDTDITRNIAPPPLALSSIAAGVGGFAINGETGNSYSGWSVANAGDVNGDGLDDLIVATPFIASNTGRNYVVFGKTSGTAVELSAVSPSASGAGGFAIYGESTSDQSGISVSTAGDINGDGLADLLVSDYNSASAGIQSGRSYVVYGKTGTAGVFLSAIAATAGSNEGFVINAQGASSWTGHSVAAAGDVNGDGFADLIIGADQRTPSNGLTRAGASYVLFGSASPAAVNLSAVAAPSGPVGGFVINGQSASDSLGYSVSGAGDVNGDGLADVIVGAYNSDPANGTNAGRSYVVYGKTGTTAVELSDVAAGNGGFVINGTTANDNHGISVANAGDVNGDGLADLIVGSVNTGNGAGKSYVVFGKTGTAAIELSAVSAGTGGFLLAPEFNGDYSGFSVASAGDMNGDGLADLIVGAKGQNRSYIVYGKTDSATVQLSAVAAGNGGILITGQSETAGNSVSAAGDVNGDGLADVIVGAITATTTAGGTYAGRSYVIFGSTGGNFASGTTVDVFGTTGNDTLSDSGVAKTIVADRGNDTITATAASVVYAGAGDDSVVIDSAMITALQSAYGSGGNVGQLVRVDGGNGLDTLSLAGTGLTLNLRQVANQAAANPDGGSRLDSIEKIDLTGSGNNTLTLDPADIRDMAGMNSFNAGNGWTALGATVKKHQLLVDGDAGDVLNASGTWYDGGSIVVGGQTYSIYNDANSATQMLVDSDITRNVTVAVDPAPTLVSSSPADNARGVVASGNIVLTFSEAVIAGTGNIVISDGTDTRTISITDTSQVTISGNTVTINPTANLNSGSAYSVQMASGVLKDTAGNNYAGISDASTLNFSTRVASVELSNIALGINGFKIDGNQAGLASGYDVSGLGDVNGDGLDDLLIGAPGYVSSSQSRGAAFVVFGKTSTTAITLAYELRDSNYNPLGFMMIGETNYDRVGSRVSSAGDMNGDGLADVLVATSVTGPNQTYAGRTYVVYGKCDNTPISLSVDVKNGTKGFTIDGKQGARSGSAMSSAGDVNGDGIDDLIVNSIEYPGTYPTDYLPNSGRAYLVFGKTGTGSIGLSTLGAGGFVINGGASEENMGNSVAGAGDVNGDGLADLIIGAEYADPSGKVDAGKTYVVFGKTDTSVVHLSALAATGGFVINGACASDRSSNAISSAGDLNGDGLADIAVGIPISNSFSKGGTYVIFGKTDGATVELSSINGSSSNGFLIVGEADVTDRLGDQAGISISAAGDINGDGLMDLLVGDDIADINLSRADAGKTYVVFGRSDYTTIQLSDVAAGNGGFVINGETSSQYSGREVSAAGDVNGDGFADLLVGAESVTTTGGAGAGRSYVVFGGKYFAPDIEQTGDASANALTGTSASESFVAGAGNDTLTGNGGADVMYGGAGNDVFALNAENISKLSAGVTGGKLARVDGGAGLDTLQVMGGTSLDLTAITNVGGGTTNGFSRIESIEKIDLATDTAANTLTIRAKDVIDMSGMNLFNVDGTATADRFHQLMIKGDAGDTVNIGSGWTATATTYTDATDSNRAYKVYQDDVTHTQLLIDNTIVTANHVI